MKLQDVLTEAEIETAAKNGISKSALWKRLTLNWDKLMAITKKPAIRGKSATKHRWETEEYAVYKGDDFVTIGTVYEIAKELGVSVQTAKFYTYPAYKKRNKKNRIILDLIEEGE